MPTPGPGPTPPNPTSTTSPTSTSTLTDTAVLAGGYHETGTITFTLISPNGTTVVTETVPVNGDGSYTTPQAYTLSTTSATGTYQWNASFTDTDGNNLNASDNGDPREQVTVSGGLASPSISTTPGTTSAACSSTLTLKDTATLSGGMNPTGTITFTLYNPDRHAWWIPRR